MVSIVFYIFVDAPLFTSQNKIKFEFIMRQRCSCWANRNKHRPDSVLICPLRNRNRVSGVKDGGRKKRKENWILPRLNLIYSPIYHIAVDPLFPFSPSACHFYSSLDDPLAIPLSFCCVADDVQKACKCKLTALLCSVGVWKWKESVKLCAITTIFFHPPHRVEWATVSNPY